jgi:hypothetical protein
MPAKPAPKLPNSSAACGASVVIVTVKFAALPPASAKVAGVKEQLAFAVNGKVSTVPFLVTIGIQT